MLFAYLNAWRSLGVRPNCWDCLVCRPNFGLRPKFGL